jgi:hypothetical protein
MKVLVCFLLLLWTTVVSSFAPTVKQCSSRPLPSSTGTVLHAEEQPELLPTPTNQVVTKVAVAGATGRTGSYVVKELLKRNVQVKGLVRNLEKAKTTFGGSSSSSLLEVVQCDLANAQQIEKSLKGCDAVIWCATGFSDAESGVLEKLKMLLGVAMSPKQSIDAVGIPAISKFMKGKSTTATTTKSHSTTTKSTISSDDLSLLPKVVMLSSAGVTRPSWDEAKKQQFPGSAEIPIVRLNPFGILDVKAESEEKLRQSGMLLVTLRCVASYIMLHYVALHYVALR